MNASSPLLILPLLGARSLDGSGGDPRVEAIVEHEHVMPTIPKGLQILRIGFWDEKLQKLGLAAPPLDQRRHLSNPVVGRASDELDWAREIPGRTSLAAAGVRPGQGRGGGASYASSGPAWCRYSSMACLVSGAAARR